MSLQVLSPREASIFACLTDTVVAPAGPLPPVAQTDAALALDRSLRSAPAANRLALRAALLAIELAPLAVGARGRLRRLDPPARTAALAKLERTAAAPLLKALRTVAHLTYYGDDGVMRLFGYDADAVVARARTRDATMSSDPVLRAP